MFKSGYLKENILRKAMVTFKDFRDDFKEGMVTFPYFHLFYLKSNIVLLYNIKAP